MRVTFLTFNDFAENTYVLSDDSGECIIVDPGCNSDAEEKRLDALIRQNALTPVRLINTHCHLDHIFGINYVQDQYGLKLEVHPDEQQLLAYAVPIAGMYGMSLDPIPPAEILIEEGDVIRFGETELEVLLTPGHSPGSICLYDRPGQQLIAGDVLFQGSIGRTDLPGGDYDTLIKSIREKLLVLDDEVTVYPGHGPPTTIGAERRTNPFLQG
ncbi:MAG: MBL fold metallo-hydrolase [Saprospiraceae bacterium]|nr:MBL fold metallo-hydrolase [Saprospiraceae bacterium]